MEVMRPSRRRMHSRRKKRKYTWEELYLGQIKERGSEHAQQHGNQPDGKDLKHRKREINRRARFVNHMNTQLEKYNFI